MNLHTIRFAFPTTYWDMQIQHRDLFSDLREQLADRGFDVISGAAHPNNNMRGLFSVGNIEIQLIETPPKSGKIATDLNYQTIRSLNTSEDFTDQLAFELNAGQVFITKNISVSYLITMTE
jgi:hypothetical protein